MEDRDGFSTPSSDLSQPIHIVGAGLAGSECAHQLARRGFDVVLHEMRPERSTPAHKSGDFAELVCSNSLRSDDPQHAAGLLKREMEGFGSLIIGMAREHAVPAGGALAVDRDRFAEAVTQTIRSNPRIEVRRAEVTELPAGDAVLATGPLTSDALAEQLQELLGEQYLYFYDAIAPIVDAESMDMSQLFAGSRYGKGDGDDYLNAAMSREQYAEFYEALTTAELAPLHDFDELPSNEGGKRKNPFFEGCLPVEEMARRGVDTLRFGPMKPVGLTPPDGSKPYAVVQLRQENLARSHYNLVGFQSRLKWGDQKRVLRLIPGLQNADFVRLGQVHRNTFINSPSHLSPTYQLRARPSLRLAGQMTGVEGYLESAATGLAVALYMFLQRRALAQGGDGVVEPFPATTAFGAMNRHLVESPAKHFQPANINYGLFTALEGRVPKKSRKALYAERAREDLIAWTRRVGLDLETDLCAA